jgi:hypothetical protein
MMTATRPGRLRNNVRTNYASYHETLQADISFVGAFIETTIGGIAAHRSASTSSTVRSSILSRRQQIPPVPFPRSFFDELAAICAERQMDLPTFETTTATSPGLTSLALSGITLNNKGLM